MTRSDGHAGIPRRESVTRALAYVAALVLVPASVWGQQGAHSLGILATHSVSSRSSAAAPECCDEVADVLSPLTVSTLEVELTIALRRGSSWGFEYPLRAVPLALARNNPTDSATRVAGGWSLSLRTPREPNLGVGVKPLGLRAWVGGDAVRLEGEVSSGVLLFSSPMLAANATHLNFVAEADIGVRVGLADGRQLVIGYRRHHLSNAGLGEVNPGLNSHVLYLGLWLD